MKSITTGLLSVVGKRSLLWFAARTPIVGGSATGNSEGGACHELNALPHCTFAKGFENSKPPPAPSPLFPSFFGSEGNDTFPRPARWRAILVPSLLNMVVSYTIFPTWSMKARGGKRGKGSRSELRTYGVV